MRRTLFGLALLLALFAAAVLGMGHSLSRSANRVVGPPPADLGAETVSLRTPSLQPVAGWFVPGRARGGAVLLLHGVRGDRRDMLARARALRRAGYAVLLIDLPAHGESPGDRVGFGLHESQGVTAALSFLRERVPDERVGVIAVSLGAASLVFSRPRPAPAAVVIESMYTTIAEAVENRLAIRLGGWGKILAPLLLWQLPLRLGIDADELRPIVALPLLDAPVLVAAGDLDQHTTLRESRRLYEAAHEPKELWVVEGAAHVDLHKHSPQAYESRVFGFLGKAMLR